MLTMPNSWRTEFKHTRTSAFPNTYVHVHYMPACTLYTQVYHVHTALQYMVHTPHSHAAAPPSWVEGSAGPPAARLPPQDPEAFLENLCKALGVFPWRCAYLVKLCVCEHMCE